MKDCPSCRKSIPSRRSLKRDENFDMIVQKMVGCATEQELDDDVKSKQDANKMVHLQRAIQKKKHLMERQKQRSAELNKHQRSAESNKQQSPLPSSAKAAAAAGILPVKNMQPSPLLELELRRHPHENKVERLERSFLTLRGDAKVSLLKTFLSRKLSENDYEITSTLDDDSVVLDDDMDLIHAQDTLCPEKERVMVLKYRLLVPPPDPAIPIEPEIPKELDVLEGFKAREARHALERGNDGKAGMVLGTIKTTAATYPDSDSDAMAGMELGTIKNTAATYPDSDSDAMAGMVLGTIKNTAAAYPDSDSDAMADMELGSIKNAAAAYPDSDSDAMADMELGSIKNAAAAYSDGDGDSDVEMIGVTRPVKGSYHEPDI
jgi:hypothetical protein